MRFTKKQKLLNDDLKIGTIYKLAEAISFLKKYASKKFDESIDLSVILGVDAKKSDQQIREFSVCQKCLKKKLELLFLLMVMRLRKPKKNGADIVGSDDLIELIKKGDIKFDKCISTPEMMVKVSAVGQILGPKGMMPNPKLGTVTKNIEEAIKNIKAGQIEYKTDKAGIVHASVGKASFTDSDLQKNVNYFFTELQKKKPSSSKGIFIKKLYINSTMGPGLQVDPTSVM